MLGSLHSEEHCDTYMQLVHCTDRLVGRPLSRFPCRLVCCFLILFCKRCGSVADSSCPVNYWLNFFLPRVKLLAADCSCSGADEIRAKLKTQQDLHELFTGYCIIVICFSMVLFAACVGSIFSLLGSSAEGLVA